MPLSSLTPTQRQMLNSAFAIYVQQQSASTATPILDLLVLTAAQLKTAVTPIVTQLQTAAQAAQTTLATTQAAQTAAVNQAVTDWAAIVSNLG